MNLWPVKHFFEHICHHFWVNLLLDPMDLLMHPPKSGDKYAQIGVQLARGSSFWRDFLQNPYFSWIQSMYYLLNQFKYRIVQFPPGSKNRTKQGHYVISSSFLKVL